MIVVDGSYGEGGGQILRSSISLSVLTGKPVTIKNIRANRSNPGLRAQHLAAIEVARKISNADVDGLELGSSKIEFRPDDIVEGRYSFEIGTAGSVTLVLHTLVPISFRISRSVSIKLMGGTDVRWSPTWDYFKKVFLHLIDGFGISVDADLFRRGFYPKGGGEIEATIYPSRDIRSFVVDDIQIYDHINGVIAVSKLREDIPKRIKHAIIRRSLGKIRDVEIDIDRDDESPSEGVSVTLWSQKERSIVGFSSLGERGLPSERLGYMCFDELFKEIKSGASVDSHLFDQIILYLSYISVHFGKRSKLFVRDISGHASTSMWLMKKFLPVDFLIERERGLYKVEITEV